VVSSHGFSSGHVQPHSSSGHISISADGVITTTVTPLRFSVDVVVVTIDDDERDELLLLLLDELLLEELLLDELLLDELLLDELLLEELLVLTVSRFARSALSPPQDLEQTHKHCLPDSSVPPVLLFADPLDDVLLFPDPLDELVFVLDDED